MKAQTAILWAAVVACGCLDLNLLDDMQLMDGGHEEASGGGADNTGDGADNTGGDGTDNTGDAFDSGPPDTDPDDTDPPVVSLSACPSGGRKTETACIIEGPVTALIRFATDEPAEVAAAVDSPARAAMISPPWSTEHRAVVDDMKDGVDFKVVFTVSDVNENSVDLEVMAAGMGGPGIAITEVLADPNGKEPAQEFVEVANIGTEQVDLSGWMIDDNGDANGDPIPDGSTLAPGEVAIIVSSSYDPAEGQDPAPDQSCRIFYLETSIGSSGLKNSAAETIELYDDLGSLISQYKGQAGKPREGCSAVRFFAELPDEDDLAWGLSPSGVSTPGEVPALP